MWTKQISVGFCFYFVSRPGVLAREGLGIGEDDDELDEEFDGEDEIEQTGCSSSNVSQLPPTPDMLRNSEYNFDGCKCLFCV